MAKSHLDSFLHKFHTSTQQKSFLYCWSKNSSKVHGIHINGINFWNDKDFCNGQILSLTWWEFLDTFSGLLSSYLILNLLIEPIYSVNRYSKSENSVSISLLLRKGGRNKINWPHLEKNWSNIWVMICFSFIGVNYFGLTKLIWETEFILSISISHCPNLDFFLLLKPIYLGPLLPKLSFVKQPTIMTHKISSSYDQEFDSSIIFIT